MFAAIAVLAIFTVAGFAITVAAEQSVELLRHPFAVRVQRAQEAAGAGMTQRLRDPGQVVVTGRQHMGLLVVQVLDAVLDLTQEYIGRAQGVGRCLRHEAGFGHTLQRVQGGASAHFGELPTAHHLEQLHGELDLADAAA